MTGTGRPVEVKLTPSSRQVVRILPHRNTNPCSGKPLGLALAKEPDRDNGMKNVLAGGASPQQARPFAPLVPGTVKCLFGQIGKLVPVSGFVIK